MRPARLSTRPDKEALVELIRRQCRLLDSSVNQQAILNYHRRRNRRVCGRRKFTDGGQHGR